MSDDKSKTSHVKNARCPREVAQRSQTTPKGFEEVVSLEPLVCPHGKQEQPLVALTTHHPPMYQQNRNPAASARKHL